MARSNSNEAAVLVSKRRPRTGQNASRTTTAESVLGLLSLGAMTGYDLRQLIEQSIGNFWSESFGQIYPALKSLVQQGLAEMQETEEESGGRPSRKVYCLTDAGRERLVHWLALPAREQVPRNELLLKIFFGFQQGPGLTAIHICRFLEEQRLLQRRYEAIERTIRAEQATNPGLPYWLLTLRAGLYRTEAMIGWAEESLQVLEGLQGKKTR